MLTKCVGTTSPVITKIINLSLFEATVPSAFKHAIVTPLHKKPSLDKEQFSNYRPVSNLTYVSKILEKVVLKRLNTFLSDNNLVNKHQSAYTKGCSHETVLVSVANTIIEAMTSQRLTGLCLLDLSSAFDTIDHTVLIERLSSWFNIGGTALSWLLSFLLNRIFSVKVGDNLSEPRDLLYGVPQGSVLGPILFSLYTTPLSTVIASQAIGHHFFADDTQSFDSFTRSFESLGYSSRYMYF